MRGLQTYEMQREERITAILRMVLLCMVLLCMVLLCMVLLCMVLNSTNPLLCRPPTRSHRARGM